MLLASVRTPFRDSYEAFSTNQGSDSRIAFIDAGTATALFEAISNSLASFPRSARLTGIGWGPWQHLRSSQTG
jgi:hypothetical protein